MFIYILSRDLHEICVLRSNSDTIRKLEHVAEIALDSNKSCVQELRFNMNTVESFLITNLVEGERSVVIPPEFKGRSYDSTKPQQRELFGSVFSFYETPEDSLLLILADIYVALKNLESDELSLYGFYAKTHKDYRDFLQSKS